jgi:hypothetical protein
MFCGWSIALLLPSVAMAFTPPSEKTIRDTIGDVSGLPAPLQRAFAPDRDSFDPMPKPAPNDWNDQPTRLSCSFPAHSTLKLLSVTQLAVTPFRRSICGMKDSQSSAVAKFHAMHESGCFVLPNPWDVGTAVYLQHLGFEALATTSAGFVEFSKRLVPHLRKALRL